MLEGSAFNFLYSVGFFIDDVHKFLDSILMKRDLKNSNIHQLILMSQ